MIAAMYVLLTYVSELMGLSKGVVQIRLSETLCVLAAFTPCAIPGVSVGCFIANVLTGCSVLDIIFGPIASLIGMIFGRLIAKRSTSYPFIFLSTLPTVISNTLITLPVIIVSYGLGDTYLASLILFLPGELISASVIGSILGITLKKSGIRI